MGTPLDIEKERFTALLCGTCGEVTSSIFVEHILRFNNHARIIILDLGDAQIKHSKEMTSKKFPDADVSYVVADARNSGLPAASIDFIDTDFMFEYLDERGLNQLFAEWRRILVRRGHIAFRTFGTTSWLSRQLDYLLIHGFCRLLMKSDVYSHSLESIENMLQSNGFRYSIIGRAFVPFGYRFVATLGA